MVDLSVTLAGGSVKLTSCLYNASGPRSGTAAALKKICSSSAGAVLTKSATLESQTGNPLPRTHHADIASFNSEGLPNSGIDYYISEETTDECMAADPDKPYIVSLSGKTLSDNLEMLRRIAAAPTCSRIAAIELNLACPNVIGKPIIGYDMDQLRDILRNVQKLYKQQEKKSNKLPPLGIKLPPYMDFSHFAQVADIINKASNIIAFVTTINTIGNALTIDTVSEAPQIASNDGYAGMSGSAVKYTALANVGKLRQLLNDEIDIVGVGGIQTGEDVFHMLLAGATCCQTATTFWKEGPDCFERIIKELEDILQRKGYNSVREVSGKLKPFSKEGAAKSREAAKAATAAAAAAASSNAQVSAVEANASRTTANKSDAESQLQFYRLVAAVLAVALAVLLADAFGPVSLLPSE